MPEPHAHTRRYKGPPCAHAPSTESDRILFRAAFLTGKVVTKGGLGACGEVLLKGTLDLLQKGKLKLI